jgi:hypothetical protein
MAGFAPLRAWITVAVLVPFSVAARITQPRLVPSSMLLTSLWTLLNV